MLHIHFKTMFSEAPAFLSAWQQNSQSLLLQRNLFAGFMSNAKKPPRKLNLDDFRPLWPLLLELIHFSLVMLQEQTTVPIVAIDDIIHYSLHQSFIPLSCLIPSTIRRLTKDVLESLREIP